MVKINASGESNVKGLLECQFEEFYGPANPAKQL